MLKDYLKTLPQYLLPKLAITQLAGLLANVQRPAVKNWLICSFIRHYDVNMKEACEENPKNYSCFNEFFIRRIKPECRPFAEAQLISPVDGYVSELGEIKEKQIFQAKGRYYTVNELLACDNNLSQRFNQGSFATLYLSPRDYHRIHMPLDAQLKKMIYVPGKLFSVQPSTVRVIPHLFARNERLVCFFETEFGLMAMVLVGATIVGKIGTHWLGEIERSKQQKELDLSFLKEEETMIKKGEEMGYFKLGSTVIILFAQGKPIHWRDDLRTNSVICLGQALGGE